MSRRGFLEGLGKLVSGAVFVASGASLSKNVFDSANIELSGEELEISEEVSRFVEYPEHLSMTFRGFHDFVEKNSLVDSDKLGFWAETIDDLYDRTNYIREGLIVSLDNLNSLKFNENEDYNSTVTGGLGFLVGYFALRSYDGYKDSGQDLGRRSFLKTLAGLVGGFAGFFIANKIGCLNSKSHEEFNEKMKKKYWMDKSDEEVFESYFGISRGNLINFSEDISNTASKINGIYNPNNQTRVVDDKIEQLDVWVFNKFAGKFEDYVKDTFSEKVPREFANISRAGLAFDYTDNLNSGYSSKSPLWFAVPVAATLGVVGVGEGVNYLRNRKEEVD